MTSVIFIMLSGYIPMCPHINISPYLTLVLSNLNPNHTGTGTHTHRYGDIWVWVHIDLYRNTSVWGHIGIETDQSFCPLNCST